MDDPGTTIKILNWLAANPSFIGLFVSMLFNGQMVRWLKRKDEIIDRKDAIINKLYEANNENMESIRKILSLVGK